MAKSNGQIILFIDELHTTWRRRFRGSMDAGNILKPALVSWRTPCNCYYCWMNAVHRERRCSARQPQTVLVSGFPLLKIPFLFRGLREVRAAPPRLVLRTPPWLQQQISLTATFLTDSCQMLPRQLTLVDEAASRFRMA